MDALAPHRIRLVEAWSANTSILPLLTGPRELIHLA